MGRLEGDGSLLDVEHRLDRVAGAEVRGERGREGRRGRDMGAHTHGWCCCF